MTPTIFVKGLAIGLSMAFGVAALASLEPAPEGVH